MLLLLSSCSIFRTPIDSARSIAGDEFVEVERVSGLFSFLTFHKRSSTSTLNIYIEGDGMSWKNRYTPSSDPTPRDPIALKMAANDSAPDVLYIARPCQYIHPENCTVDVWTGGRFSEDIITAFSEVIKKIVREYNYKKINLLGYSGGGTVAALLAIRLNNVQSLTTIAGVLDHKSWTSFHNVSPLNNSLNPSDFIDKLKNITQVHFCGENDKKAPCSLTEKFLHKLNSPNATLHKIQDFDHKCCWSTIRLALYPF